MQNYSQTTAQGNRANNYKASEARSHKHLYKRTKARAVDFATDRELNPHEYEPKAVLRRIQNTRDEIKRKQERLDEYNPKAVLRRIQNTRDEIKRKQERLDEYNANPFAKVELTDEQIALIKLRFINGESPRKIAPDFNIGATKAREICELLPNYKTIAAKRKTVGARVVEKGRRKGKV